jgi:hypothetical protein
MSNDTEKKEAELLSHYLKATPENTKSGGVLRLKLPKVAKNEVLDLYLQVRSEGTKDVFLSTKVPVSISGDVADLYLKLRPEGTKDADFSVKYKGFGKGK